ncbi:hypothetical protein GCM10011510_18090 [Streptococcus himalayensis]|uniref:Uncharacterized protein n=1 Tax=Streptococcus himalayensis TaxID=1888195 RepID=A0A917ABM4_9STRE|nr:hypothetical protein GCM10011510_18090 [Streptococcus himalayensis]
MQPVFYENTSEILGVFPIRDSDDKLLLPKYPEKLYQVDGKQVGKIHILFINSSDETVISEVPFRQGLKILSSKIVKETDIEIVIHPLIK